MAETGDRITRIYGNFRGADFRGEEINLGRSPDCLNVWRDYKKTTSIETRPGMKMVAPFDDTVYGVFFYAPNDTEICLVHCGTKLYKVENGKKTELYSGLNAAPSDSFIYNSVWYFKDGKNYLQYDGKTIKDVEGYIPTTTIGITAIGDGTGTRTPHEDVNLLSPYRINTMRGNGADRVFQLDAQGIDKDFPIEVTVNGQKLPSTITVRFYNSKGILIATSTVKHGEMVYSPTGLTTWQLKGNNATTWTLPTKFYQDYDLEPGEE